MFTVPLALLSAIPFAIYCWFRRDVDRRRRFARRTGVTSTLLLGGFWLLFAMGELFTDKPGAESWLLLSAWLVPTLVCSMLAWWRPNAFRPVGIGLVTVIGLATAASLVFQAAWRDLVNDHGPLIGVAALAAALPIALYGRVQPRAAGILMLGLGAMPLLGGPSMSGEALAGPILIGALWLLFAASDAVPGHSATPATPSGSDSA